jgi:hypothetical protein
VTGGLHGNRQALHSSELHGGHNVAGLLRDQYGARVVLMSERPALRGFGKTSVLRLEQCAVQLGAKFCE